VKERKDQMVTFTKDGHPVIETEAKVTYELAHGPTWVRFFEGLKEEKIFGNKCPKCERVLVPARSFCPRCFVEMGQWIELPPEGVLVGWSLTEIGYFGMPTEPPFITGVFNLKGADCSFMHLLGGVDLSDVDAVRNIIKNGMRVKVVWNEIKNGCILDIKYFTPAE
jgi:uncharacterized OB-fold protein